MDALVERSQRRWPARVFRRFAAPETQVQKLEQSAAQRARVDASAWVSDRPITFGLLTAASTAGATALGAWLATALPVAAQAGVAIGSACVGFMAPVWLLFTIEWVAAFPRQRNEARDEIKRLTQPADVSELAREFSDWVGAKRASLPRHGWRIVPSFPDPDSEAWISHEKREDEIERLQASARAEYHERFRSTVVGILGGDAEDPQNIVALEELAEKLRQRAESEQRAERVSEAQGTPVGVRHRDLLEGLLEAVQLAAANELAVNYGDTPEGGQHNRDSFAAHFKSLMPAVQTWHMAVDRLEAAAEKLRNWIPGEVSRRGFSESDYFDGTVAQCFSELTVGRARRHELDDPLEIHLRCVQDVTTEDGKKRWSAYLHSGRNEVKVAELSHEVEEFSEEGMAELNKVIAGMDKALQACFEALQRSDAATQVTAAQDALRALRQPLLDQLRRQRISFDPVFSESCPYCLAEIGLDQDD